MLLYIMPEVDAFYCFKKIVDELVPTYGKDQIPGPLKAFEIFKAILKQHDPYLTEILYQKFSRVPLDELIFSFNIPNDESFEEAYLLWDVSIALGFNMNVLFAVSRFILLRDKIIEMDVKNTNNLPDLLSSLNGKAVLEMTFPILYSLQDEIFDQLVNHTLIVYDVPNVKSTQVQN